MRAGACILGAAVALALSAVPAVAVAPGSGWGPDVRLASSVDAGEPAFAAMSLDDDAIVGWTRLTNSGRTALVRRRTGPRGIWQAPVSLGAGRLVGLAMDRDGDALAVVQAGSAPPRGTRIRRDGSLATSQLGAAGRVARVLEVTLRQDGRAAALVLRPGGTAIGYLVQDGPGEPWSGSGPDLPIPGPDDLVTAINRAGQAVVAWVDPGGHAIPAATRYALGSQWKPFPAGLPGSTPAAATVGRPRAVIGDDGSAAVIWTVFPANFDDPDTGAGSFITTGPGPTADAVTLPVPGPVAGTAVSATGTAMVAWAESVFQGDLWASRFAPVTPAWPIGIRLLAPGDRLEEGAFAVDAVTSRRGPVLVEASLETGPGPDGQVAFARDSRGAPWGAARGLTFTRGVPALVAGDLAGLVALAVDDDGTLVVTPYDRLPRVSKLTARRSGGRMVVTLTLSRTSRMTGTIRSLSSGSTVSVVPRDVTEGTRTLTLNPVGPGRYRLHLTMCARGFGCAPTTRIVSV